MKLQITDARAAELAELLSLTTTTHDNLCKWGNMPIGRGSEATDCNCGVGVSRTQASQQFQVESLANVRALLADRATLLAEVERLRGERIEAYAVVYAAEEYRAGRISQEQFFEVLKAKEQA